MARGEMEECKNKINVTRVPDGTYTQHEVTTLLSNSSKVGEHKKCTSIQGDSEKNTPTQKS